MDFNKISDDEEKIYLALCNNYKLYSLFIYFFYFFNKKRIKMIGFLLVNCSQPEILTLVCLKRLILFARIDKIKNGALERN